MKEQSVVYNLCTLLQTLTETDLLVVFTCSFFFLSLFFPGKMGWFERQRLFQKPEVEQQEA